MPRPDQSDQRRAEWIPVLARCFAEHGYRRATTAMLAREVGTQENALFRLWPSKKAMFLAAIDHVFAATEQAWQSVIEEQPDDGSTARQLLAWEASHHGQNRLYRIVFAGLSETDDPDIRRRLQDRFLKAHDQIVPPVRDHRGDDSTRPDVPTTAWGFVALGLLADVFHELDLLDPTERTDVFLALGRPLLDGASPAEST